MTKQWWHERREKFDLFTSQFVLDEASDGDPIAASERLKELADIESLALLPQIEPLAQRLLDAGALPQIARLDALHLAVSAVHHVRYLLTWNCKHLATRFCGVKWK